MFENLIKVVGLVPTFLAVVTFGINIYIKGVESDYSKNKLKFDNLDILNFIRLILIVIFGISFFFVYMIFFFDKNGFKGVIFNNIYIIHSKVTDLIFEYQYGFFVLIWNILMLALVITHKVRVYVINGYKSKFNNSNNKYIYLKQRFLKF